MTEEIGMYSSPDDSSSDTDEVQEETKLLEPKKDIESPKKKKYDDQGNNTLFIRNLSYETEEDTLKEFIETNFGQTDYCLVCKNRDSGESKGTGFIRFKDPADATKCLEEFKDRDLQTKFHLDGRNLIILPALSRDKVQEATQKNDKHKDKRNLALSKEGFIHSASEESLAMSKNDREKRKVLYLRKRDQLNNLHNFVSDTRLCVHNLPASIDDQRLRKIFLSSIKEEYPNAKIIECRVMRNKKGDGKLGTSKGFGFVAFSKHEHALAALRNTNNNPNTFNKDKRPIVEFSVENMVALNKKKTRMVNSQRKNQIEKVQKEKKSIKYTMMKRRKAKKNRAA